MEPKCKFSECEQQPEFCCSCTYPSQNFCGTHFLRHLESDSAGPHEARSYIKILDESEVRKIHGALANRFRSLQESKKNIIQAGNSLKKTIDSVCSKGVKKISMAQKEIQLSLDEFSSEVKFGDSSDSFAKQLIQNGPQQRQKLLCFLGLKEMKFHITNLLSEIEECLTIKEELDLNFSDNYSDLYYADELIHFNRDSKELVRIQLPQGKRRVTTMPYSKNFGIQAAICKLPGDQYFHYGGFTSFFGICSDCYIISSSGIQEYTPYHHIFSSSACYWEDSVYVFGGCNVFTGKIACKFELSNKTWSEIQPLPVAMSSTSSISFNECIYLTGYQANSLYSYDPKFDSYSKELSLKKDSHKLLCRSNQAGYLISEDGIFVRRRHTEYWEKKEIGKKLKEVITKPMQYLDKIYFLDCDLNLNVFDFTDFTIREKFLI